MPEKTDQHTEGEAKNLKIIKKNKRKLLSLFV